MQMHETQTATQANTPYTIIDAKTPVVDVVVGVRIAWPLLPQNAPDYDAQMHKLFDSVLESVAGALGRPPRTDGEAVRRPVNSPHIATLEDTTCHLYQSAVRFRRASYPQESVTFCRKPSTPPAWAADAWVSTMKRLSP